MPEYSEYPNWLEFATAFNLGQSEMYGRNIVIENRLQFDGSKRWVVKMDSWVLGSDLHWHYEDIPSNRSKKFIKLTRFESKEIAYQTWVEHIDEGKTHRLCVNDKSYIE